MRLGERGRRWIRRSVLALLALTAILLPAAYLILQQPPFGGRFEGTRLQRMRQSPEYKDGRFENTPPQKKDLALIRTLQNYAGGQQREPGFEIPVMKLDRAMLEKPAEPGLRAYWFGHASVLVEIDGARIMTDPILSDYASPFQFIGPRRLHPPPLPLKDLSGIDAVVISHDHFDHLDMGTVVQLARGGSHFYVGLAVGAHLERWGVPSSQIHEMDWWEQAERSGVVVHATPARHYSGRKSMDNSTLWASWWVKGPHHSFYFSGDTGYGPHFREIADRLGPADLALIKIGAYGETWLDIHMDPEAAIQAALDVHATTMLPVHWATFNLSYHAWVEPIVRARGAASTRGVDLVTPRVGERFEFGQPFRSVAWYDGPG